MGNREAWQELLNDFRVLCYLKLCVFKLWNRLKTAAMLQFAENTAHRKNPQRATETEGDPLSIRRFCFTGFPILHLFIRFGGDVGSAALRSALKQLTSLQPGSIFQCCHPRLCNSRAGRSCYHHGYHQCLQWIYCNVQTPAMRSIWVQGVQPSFFN